jgi:hypothetical protein
MAHIEGEILVNDRPNRRRTSETRTSEARMFVAVSRQLSVNFSASGPPAWPAVRPPLRVTSLPSRVLVPRQVC